MVLIQCSAPLNSVKVSVLSLESCPMEAVKASKKGKNKKRKMLLSSEDAVVPGAPECQAVEETVENSKPPSYDEDESDSERGHIIVETPA